MRKYGYRNWRWYSQFKAHLRIPSGIVTIYTACEGIYSNKHHSFKKRPTGRFLFKKISHILINNTFKKEDRYGF